MALKLVSHIPHINTVTEKLSACASALDDLEHIYSDKFLTDVELVTKTNSFPAHKIVLCARCPVFKLMFGSDMREANSSSIQVDDLEDDTVQRLLLFLYSDKIKDLQWDTASALYYAADKYNIEKLKLICSSFLIDNLSTSTVTELLVLADTHSDSDLLRVVEYFILDHEEIVFCSDQWEKLMDANPRLALKAMNFKYKIKKEKLEFTVSPTKVNPQTQMSIEEMKKHLLSLLEKDAELEEVFDWIDANVSDTSGTTFVRALVTAVHESCLSGSGTTWELNMGELKSRIPLVSRYVSTIEKLQLQVLYALQTLMIQLGQPSGLLHQIFDVLLYDDVISEESFKEWEQSDDPNEAEGKGVAVLSVKSFFKWLREPV